MNRSSSEDTRFCREVLPEVSRTFALTIRVLPPSLRESVTVAYLLCRIADVLEDATGLDPSLRIDGLESFAGALSDLRVSAEELSGSLDPADRLPLQDSCSRRLIRGRLAVLRSYTGLPEAERDVLSRWIQAMALGMSSFVERERRFSGVGAIAGTGPAGPGRASPGASSDVAFILETRDELRAYAYYVAGTVGHLLTELFTLHLGRRAPSPDRLRDLAGPFGLGLQFTNIIQDMAEDRRRGWSYVPEEMARSHGTSVHGLDDPDGMPAALRVVGELVHEAAGYLDRAMEYTLLMPRCAPRIRLFCLWPTFFAMRTLVRLWGEERVVSGVEKVRITRREVRRVMGATVAASLSDRFLKSLYKAERERLRRRIELAPV